jgi:hypothetical protein
MKQCFGNALSTVTRIRIQKKNGKSKPGYKRLMERHGATFGPRDAIEMPPLQRFEEQLRARLGARYPDLSPDQFKKLQERIVRAVERQKGQLGETRSQPLDAAPSALDRAPGSQERESYER